MDEYIYGKVSRISPEAPIPIVDQISREHRPGGAANVALNLVNLGVRTSLIGVVGKDPNGALLSDLIDDMGIIAQSVIIKDEGRITTCKTRVVAQNQHVVRIDHEEHTPVSGEITRLIIDHISFLHRQQRLDAVILQDYEKGVFHPDNIEEIIRHIKSLSVRIVVDPKDRNFWHYKEVDLFKPNRKEAEKALGRRLEMSSHSLYEAAGEIEAVLNNRISLITLSEHGLYIKEKNNGLWQRSEILDVIDVCGAGDAVISVIAAAFCAGMGLDDMASLGNISGALICSVRGVAAIDLAQLDRAYLNRLD